MDLTNVLPGEKEYYQKNYTLASTPQDISVTCTIPGDVLTKIKGNPEGEVLLFSEMIDEFDSVLHDLAADVQANYSLRDLSEIKKNFNFLLTDLSISDIQTMDSNGGLVVGGSLVLPALDCISHPVEHRNGTWKKLHDLDAPKAYVLGKRHAFVQPLKSSEMSRTHHLIKAESRTLNPVLYPNMNIVGGSSSPIAYKVRPDQSLEVHAHGPVLLHGHMINNGTAYANSKRPICSQYLRPMPGEAIQTEYHIHLPTGSYPHAWFHKRTELQKEDGCLVPLDDYTQACYDFMQQVNSNRSTNFSSSGIWWNTQMMRDVPCMKFTLNFRIVPIIEIHEDNAESIPYAVLRKHLRSQLVHTDKMNLH